MSIEKLKFSEQLQIDDRKIGGDNSVYFIADIAANHDGSLEKAKDLIYLAAESGANAAKFQHFSAGTIVSEYGFKNLATKLSHQSKWKKSVYQVYEDASINLDWTETLKKTCQNAGIAFFTSPYSLELVDYIDAYVSAFKIGSGDITWLEIIKGIASKGKPYILATGASSIIDVINAVQAGAKINEQIALLQCNTNYTGEIDNFKFINLRVLNTYKTMFDGLILGLSDHTPGHSTVLGAVALGAKIIEKHFTSNCGLDGPDHEFSMDPKGWKEMVDRTRELEMSLGTGLKKIEQNELETSIVQRRSIRLCNSKNAGDRISETDLIMLRPCPQGALEPFNSSQVIGKKLRIAKEKGEHIEWRDLE